MSVSCQKQTSPTLDHRFGCTNRRAHFFIWHLASPRYYSKACTSVKIEMNCEHPTEKEEGALGIDCATASMGVQHDFAGYLDIRVPSGPVRQAPVDI
jgi:hypothetical protein